MTPGSIMVRTGSATHFSPCTDIPEARINTGGGEDSARLIEKA
jgi:hypothetical protein